MLGVICDRIAYHSGFIQMLKNNELKARLYFKFQEIHVCNQAAHSCIYLEEDASGSGIEKDGAPDSEEDDKGV